MKSLKKTLLAIALCNFMLFAFPVVADAMRIYVKNAYGVSILLEVDPLDAIERVNQKIFDIKGSPPENMLLYFGAKQLEEP